MMHHQPGCDNWAKAWIIQKACFAMGLLTAMRTFVETVQAGSMNGAAKNLNVTSALVGQRIAALETHLQVRLLNRTTRQQSLTPFGESYLEQCQDILELVARSEGRASDQRREPQGRLRIAAPVSFGTAALVPGLEAFARIAPQVEIDLVLSDANEDLIASGIDVAFRIGPLEDSTLMQTRLAPYRMVACAAPEYLAAHSDWRTPADLAQGQAILFSKTGERPWRFSKGGKTESWTPRATLRVNSGEAVRVAVRAGMGLAMLPEVLVSQDLETGALVRILPEWDLPERPMTLIYHRDRYRPQRLVKFIEFAQARFRSSLTV